MTPQDYLDEATQVLISATGLEWQAAVQAAEDLQKAGLLPSDTEWSIETKTFVGDEYPFDKRETTEHMTRLPLSEASARESVALRTSALGQYSPETMRLTSRGVTDWRPTL